MFTKLSSKPFLSFLLKEHLTFYRTQLVHSSWLDHSVAQLSSALNYKTIISIHVTIKVFNVWSKVLHDCINFKYKFGDK